MMNRRNLFSLVQETIFGDCKLDYAVGKNDVGSAPWTATRMTVARPLIIGVTVASDSIESTLFFV